MFQHLSREYGTRIYVQNLLWFPDVFTLSLLLFATVFIVTSSANYGLLALCLGLPALLVTHFPIKRKDFRVLQLVCILGFYCLSLGVVFALSDVISRWIDISLAVKVIFLAYFTVQCAGFVSFSIKNKRYIPVIATALSFFTLVYYVLDTSHAQPSFEQLQPILPFGANDPVYIIVTYCAWFLCTITNSTRLPKLTEMTAHVASVLFAIVSGSFMFYRILTAYVLFLLDYFFNFSRQDLFGKSSLSMSEEFYAVKWPRVRFALGIFSLSILSVNLLVLVLY